MNDKKRASLASGLAILAGGVGVMTQVLPQQAILFSTLALGIALCAMVVVLSKYRTRRWTIAIVGITSAAMSITLMNTGGSIGAAVVKTPVALPAYVASSVVYDDAGAKPDIVSASMDSATTTRLVEQAAAQQNRSREIVGSDQIRVLAAAKASGYKIQSGLTPDFSTAQVYNVGNGTVLAAVQLRGTNAPEMSRVSYVYAGGKLEVIETASRMLDANNVSLKAWTDGQLRKNVVISRASPVASSASVQNVGLSWSTLNSCLASAGVSWWVFAALSVVCGIACLTLVGCAPCIAAQVGWLGGMASACVYRAWT